MAIDYVSDRLVTYLQDRPDLQAKPHSNHISALCDGKVFAYTRAGGLVLKLPASRIDELEGAHQATRLVMGKKRMAEWAVLAEAASAEPSRFSSLLDEAAAFVSGS